MLKSPSGKIYIGQTTRPIKKRFKEHRTGHESSPAIYKAIKKYGWDNFEKDYYECPDNDLDFDEELLVREMSTLVPEGYNLKTGGSSNGKMSDETKQKMSESHLGEKNHMWGKFQSDESKQKNREAHLGKPQSDDTIQKKSGENNHRSKRVYQYDLEGNLLGSFGSCGEAGKSLKKSSRSINACANGVPRYKTAYGFKWSYNNDR